MRLKITYSLFGLDWRSLNSFLILFNFDCVISIAQYWHIIVSMLLFVGGHMSYLRYLCLFAYSGVQHILCSVFVLFFLVLCTLCCQFLCVVHFYCPCCLFGLDWRSLNSFLILFNFDCVISIAQYWHIIVSMLFFFS
jgi:hypothetical protein